MAFEDLARSFTWLVLLLLIGIGSAIAVTSEVNRVDIQNEYHLLVRDSIDHGVHKLSGAIAVDTTCDQLTIQTEQKSKHSFALVFNTWRQPHTVDCRTGSTRAFTTTIMANTQAPLSFSALYNGSPISVLVVPEVPIAPPGKLNAASSAESLR